MADNHRATGMVKWFSGQKGFGFITPDEGSEDLFVHQTDIRSDGFRTLREGQQVEFVIGSGEDGRSKAVDVVGLGGSYRPGEGRGGGTVRGGGRGGFGGSGSYGRYGGGYGRGGGGYGRSGGGRGGYADGGGMECYNCGRPGHLARDCYRNNSGGGPGGNQDYGGGERGYGGRGGGGGRGRPSGGACYSCGEEGHFARDCPNEQ